MRLVIALVTLVIVGVTSIALWAMPKEVVQSSPRTPVVSSNPLILPTGDDEEKLTDSTTFVSSDKSFQFDYPSSWTHIPTTPEAGRGAYGEIVESWIVQSFAPIEPGRGGIPDSSVKIDFEISRLAESKKMEELVGCEDKKVTCENVKVNGLPYKKATSIAKDGIIHISFATIQEGTAYITRVLLTDGDLQDENLQLVSQVMQTYKIQ